MTDVQISKHSLPSLASTKVLRWFDQRPNSWTKSRQKFFSSLLFTVTSTFLFLHTHTTFLQTLNLLHISIVKLLYTVKEKGDNIDRKPYPLSYGLINPYRNSQDYAQNPQRNCKLLNSASEEVFEIGSHPFPTRED